MREQKLVEHFPCKSAFNTCTLLFPRKKIYSAVQCKYYMTYTKMYQINIKEMC